MLPSQHGAMANTDITVAVSTSTEMANEETIFTDFTRGDKKVLNLT